MRGIFKDEHPRIILTLTGKVSDIEIEFIIDTGFAGDLALPVYLVNQLEGELIGFRDRRLATGQEFRCPAYHILVDWNDEPRPTEVFILEGDPLLGTGMLSDQLLQIEITDGGEVVVEPL